MPLISYKTKILAIVLGALLLVPLSVSANIGKVTKQEGQDASISRDSDTILTDEGIGIIKEDMDKLFHPFFRSDALNHKEIFGNGLGLSIAKKAADAINAKLNLESVFGVGTTVTVTF